MNKNFLSNRMKGVEESATLKLNALAQKLKAEGKNIINLTAGEPDFPALTAAKNGVKKALENEWSKYTPTAGLLDLRKKIADFTNRNQQKLNSTQLWTAQNVVVTNGGKQSIFNAVLSLVNPGDEVLIPAPYWVSYPEMVKIADGKVKIIETTFDDSFKLTAQTLQDALTSKTKILFLNSPSNPTGAVYTREEFQQLGKVLEQFPNVWVFSDEIYDLIQYRKERGVSFLEACPQFWKRTVTLSGLSKSANLTGWRIGWSVADTELTQAMIALQGHSTSGICSLSQAAALEVLDLGPEVFEQQRQEFESRRDLALETLKKSAKIKVFVPDGAFYVWIGVHDVLKGGEDAQNFAEKCLETAGVAVVPGNAFGNSKFIRISFSIDRKSLQEACDRLVRFVDQY